MNNSSAMSPSLQLSPPVAYQGVICDPPLSKKEQQATVEEPLPTHQKEESFIDGGHELNADAFRSMSFSARSFGIVMGIGFQLSLILFDFFYIVMSGSESTLTLLAASLLWGVFVSAIFTFMMWLILNMIRFSYQSSSHSQSEEILETILSQVHHSSIVGAMVGASIVWGVANVAISRAISETTSELLWHFLTRASVLLLCFILFKVFATSPEEERRRRKELRKESSLREPLLVV